MVLVCHNVLGVFVLHPSWYVEGGGAKVSKHPVEQQKHDFVIYLNSLITSIVLHLN